MSVNKEQMLRTEQGFRKEILQRAVGWCETAERMFGTRLGAAVRNLLYNKKKVDTDGIPAVTKGRI